MPRPLEVKRDSAPSAPVAEIDESKAESETDPEEVCTRFALPPKAETAAPCGFGSVRFAAPGVGSGREEKSEGISSARAGNTLNSSGPELVFSLAPHAESAKSPIKGSMVEARIMFTPRSVSPLSTGLIRMRHSILPMIKRSRLGPS